MAYESGRPGGKASGHKPAEATWLWATDGVDAPEEAVQAARAEPPFDRLRVEPNFEQLAVRDHPVLPLRLSPRLSRR